MKTIGEILKEIVPPRVRARIASGKVVRKIMKETSLSRIYGHTAGDRAIGIITAFKSDRELPDNRAANANLIQDIRDANFGFVRVNGYYYSTDEDGNKQLNKEESIFVIGRRNDDSLKGLLVKWGKKYGQEAVLYKPFNRKDAYIIGTDENGRYGYKKIMRIGKWHPNKIGEYYSELKGRPFIFEGISRYHHTTSMFGRMITDKLIKDGTIKPDDIYESLPWPKDLKIKGLMDYSKVK